MNMQHLRYFIELAHTQNYTAAAQHLHITQPSLSYAIGQLEEELGVPLFVRNGRSSTITAYGREFLTYAEGALKTIELGMDAIHSSSREETVIRLGLLRFLGVRYIPELVNGFLKAYPDYSVRFEFDTGFTSFLLDGLNASRYDAIFCAPSRRYQRQGTFVGHQNLYLVVPEDHPLSVCDSVRLEDTFPYPYIYYPEGASTRSIIEHNFKGFSERVHVKYEIMEERVVAGFIGAGFGIGILPNMALLQILPVKKLEISDPPIGRDIYMLPTVTRTMTPALEAFLRYVKKHPWDGEI